MSELKMISPLLDNMEVDRESTGQSGCSYYYLHHSDTGERFVLKVLSVPALDSQVRALILSGAYPSEEAVHEYYGRVAEDIKQELEIGKQLAQSECFVGSVSYEILPKETGVGYDIYILYPLYIPLSDLISHNAMTGLRAINMGLDLCDSLCACRNAGYLFDNLRPENIFLMPNGRFLLGDLGLVALEDLEYAGIPEDYLGSFSAPELSDFMSAPNPTIDLYSLGMVLYRIYNGNHGPFEDEDTAENMADRLRMTGKPLPTPLYADYELSAIILKACAFKQEDRYQTPEEMKDALTLYMQRNEVTDTLIIPPIITAEEPIIAEAEEKEEAPVRMTDVEQLDETFCKSFAPDQTGGGTEADIDPAAESIVAAQASAMAQPAASGSGAAPATAEADAAEAAVSPAENTDTAKNVSAKEAASGNPPTDENASASDDDAESAPASQEVSPAAKPEASEDRIEADIARSAAAIHDSDDDQMDLDTLLASVSAVVGTTHTPEVRKAETPQELSINTEPVHDTYADAASDEYNEPITEDKPRHRVLRSVLILLLVGALCLSAYFFLSWYYVDISNFSCTATTDSISVDLFTGDSLDSFTVTCTDVSGTSYSASIAGNRYTFSGLQESTTYYVTIYAAKHHRLSSSNEHTRVITTPEKTVISEFTAQRGERETEVLLSFNHEGPAPKKWKLSYTNASGSHRDTLEFTDNNVLIHGLNLDETYTFTLDPSENIFLDGELTLTYEMVPVVELRTLNINDVTGNSVTVVWEAADYVPGEWTVTCEAENFTAVSATVTEGNYTFELPDLTREYTISVTARGMDKPETLIIPANPIVVANLKAEPQEDGSLALSWDTPVGIPEGGWRICYNPVGSYHAAYISSNDEDIIEGNSTTLTGLIPNTPYELMLCLTAEDADSQIFGSITVNATTADTGVFKDYNISPAPPYTENSAFIALFNEPDNADWKYTDLSDRRTSYTAEEHIAVCIEVKSIGSSEDTVSIIYAIRDSEGHVVNDVSETMTWNDLWYSRRHANAIPLPAASGKSSTPGDYTLEIYINGKLLASKAFSIT